MLLPRVIGLCECNKITLPHSKSTSERTHNFAAGKCRATSFLIKKDQELVAMASLISVELEGLIDRVNASLHPHEQMEFFPLPRAGANCYHYVSEPRGCMSPPTNPFRGPLRRILY